MNQPLNPKSVHPPLGKYSHTIKVPNDAQWLVVSGQVGMDRSGRLARGIDKQAERAFRNVLACLRENKMKPQDLVKITLYLTDPRNADAARAARLKVFGENALPTSTLVVIDGLASAEMLIEVEAWAACA